MKGIIFGLLSHLLHAAASQSTVLQHCKSYSTAATTLKRCQLPPLTSPMQSLDGTWMEVYQFHACYVQDPQTAQCACSSIAAYQECEKCAGDMAWKDMERSTAAEYLFKSRAYRKDCNSWGYFSDPKYGYPTTPRNELPSQQASPEERIRKCSQYCDFLSDQAASCKLPSLKSPTVRLWSRYPPYVTETPENDTVFLKDRSSSECFCTNPVLRRLAGCGQCLQNSLDNGVSPHYNATMAYGDDCKIMGYYADVLPMVHKELRLAETTSMPVRIITIVPVSSNFEALSIVGYLIHLGWIWTFVICTPFSRFLHIY